MKTHTLLNLPRTFFSLLIFLFFSFFVDLWGTWRRTSLENELKYQQKKQPLKWPGRIWKTTKTKKRKRISTFSSLLEIHKEKRWNGLAYTTCMPQIDQELLTTNWNNMSLETDNQITKLSSDCLVENLGTNNSWYKSKTMCHENSSS